MQRRLLPPMPKMSRWRSVSRLVRESLHQRAVVAVLDSALCLNGMKSPRKRERISLMLKPALLSRYKPPKEVRKAREQSENGAGHGHCTESLGADRMF
jgi:hypothetical protein